MVMTEMATGLRSAERDVNVCATSAAEEADDVVPSGPVAAAAEPARFLVLRARAEMSCPESVEAFATEDEARRTFATWVGGASSRGHWGEVAQVGGGGRPVVLVWTGRPFPPVSESDLETLL